MCASASLRVITDQAAQISFQVCQPVLGVCLVRPNLVRGQAAYAKHNSCLCASQRCGPHQLSHAGDLYISNSSEAVLE